MSINVKIIYFYFICLSSCCVLYMGASKYHQPRKCIFPAPFGQPFGQPFGRPFGRPFCRAMLPTFSLDHLTYVFSVVFPGSFGQVFHPAWAPPRSVGPRAPTFPGSACAHGDKMAKWWPNGFSGSF